MAAIFVSHSTEDHAFAAKLCAALHARGVTTWFAPRDLVPGSMWADAIPSAVASSGALALLLSHNSVRSKHVKRELLIADDRGLPIYPIRLDDAPLDGSIEYILAGSQWVDGRRDEIDVIAMKLATSRDSPRTEPQGDESARATRATSRQPKTSNPYEDRSSIRRDVFWALAPTDRDVLDETGSLLFNVGPTEWALVIEDRGSSLVIRHPDGRIGYLHDVDGVTRG